MYILIDAFMNIFRKESQAIDKKPLLSLFRKNKKQPIKTDCYISVK